MSNNEIDNSYDRFTWRGFIRYTWNVHYNWIRSLIEALLPIVIAFVVFSVSWDFIYNLPFMEGIEYRDFLTGCILFVGTIVVGVIYYWFFRLYDNYMKELYPERYKEKNGESKEEFDFNFDKEK